jgi:putative flippase GtrA
MKASWRLFGGLSVFYVLVTIIYWQVGGEPVGIGGMLLAACLAGMVAFYVWFTQKRIGVTLPEDNLTAIAITKDSNILISAVFGRIVAGLFNFSLGKLFVFQSKSSAPWEFFKYILTVIILGLISFELIDIMVQSLNLNVYLSKIIAETALFLVSFAIQRTFVFSTSKDE